MRYSQGILFAGTAFGLALAPTMASAQEAQNQTFGVDDIVVTASRRSESLQDVPLAISALSGDSLSRMGADRIEDLAQSAPGISLMTNGSPITKIVMRGITSGNIFEAHAASTGFYLDDIPLSSTFTAGGTDLRLFDLNRIEVLRGPQGTLYGAGAMGGAVRVITNQPDPTAFAGKGEVTGAVIAERAPQVDLNGMVNIPLVKDRLALRAVGIYRNQAGYVDDPIAKRDALNWYRVIGGRLALQWRPSDDLIMTLTGLYQKSEIGGHTEMDVNLSGQPLYGDLKQYKIYPETSISTTKTLNLSVKYDMSWASLESSTSYFANDGTFNTDLTLSLGVLLPGQPGYHDSLPDTNRTFVQEVRLLSRGDGPLKWVLGGYFQTDQIVAYRKDRFDPASALGMAGLVPLDYYSLEKRKTFAIFGEATYKFAPKFEVIVGARYSIVPTDFLVKFYGVLIGIPDPANIVDPGFASSTNTDFSPKFQLIYHPSKDIMLYGLVAKGFRPGSPNAKIPGVQPVLEPDFLWDYELGAKMAFFDNRLTVNLAAYYIDWTNIQIATTTPANSQPPIPPSIPYLANVGTAKSKGVELEITARPSRGVTFTLTGSYTDARYTSPNPAIAVVAGQRIPNVARFSGSASIDVEQALNDQITGFARFDLRYESDKSAGTSATAKNLLIPGYAIGSLRVGARWASGTALTFFVDNLWDKRYATGIVSNYLCLTQSTCPNPLNTGVSAKLSQFIGQPRTIGLTLSHDF